MSIADRIQYLRKTKGLSQEELADKVGVSRQAVSKWESEQSIPDLDRIIMMSDFFEVTTDYILKGIDLVACEKESKGDDNRLGSKIFFIGSTLFMAIGLFCGFGGWYAEQTMEVVWGSMMIQAIGVAGFFIGRLLSDEKPSFIVVWLNLMIGLFMPLSMVSGIISVAVFHTGWAAPYPTSIGQFILFAIAFLGIAIASFVILKKRKA